MKKSFLLLAFALFILCNNVMAGQFGNTAFPNRDFSWGRLTPVWDYSLFSRSSGEDSRPYDGIGSMGKLGIGAANIFLGLGSFLAGEWQDGLSLTIGQGLGIAMFLGGAFLYSGNKGDYFAGQMSLLILSYIGMGAGAFVYASYLLNGFTFPFGFSVLPIGASPSVSQSNRRNRSFNMTVLPHFDGQAGGRLMFTARF